MSVLDGVIRERTESQEQRERFPIHPLFDTFEEVPEVQLTDVHGKLPDWLSGTVIRVGPGKFEFGDDKMQHWFDGHGIVHRFSIRSGQVSFQSKYVETDAYKANTAAQRITMAEFGTAASPDPCATKFARIKSRFVNMDRSDNVNTNVFKYGDVIITNTDSPVAMITDTDLERKDKLNMADLLAVTLSSSHPHFDADGTMYTIGSSFKGKPHHHIIKIPAPPANGVDTAIEYLKKAKIVVSLPSRYRLSPSYTHSFGMTENYFIFCETPVTLNLFKSLSTVVRGKPMNNNFDYDPNDTALFHVIRKKTGEVLNLKFEIKGLFFWHIINCYEQDQHVVVDLCHLSNFKNTDLFTEPLEEFRNGLFIEAKKWSKYEHHPLRLVLPLKDPELAPDLGSNMVSIPDTDCKAYVTGKTTYRLVAERLLPAGMDRIDMPQINYDMVNGKRYQFFYGSGLFVNQYFMNGLGKVDVTKKTCRRWKGTIDQYPSEPIFVANPNGKDEDDGVVLASVSDVDPAKRDFMLVLDAKSFTEIARAYVPAHTRVPYSLHGSFYK